MGYREHKRARKERNKEAESRREGSPSVLASFQWKLFRTWETWCRSAVQSARLACGFPSEYRHERSSPSTGPLSLACLREQQTHAAKARPHTRTHTHTMADANAYTLKWMHKYYPLFFLRPNFAKNVSWISQQSSAWWLAVRDGTRGTEMLKAKSQLKQNNSHMQGPKNYFLLYCFFTNVYINSFLYLHFIVFFIFIIYLYFFYS